MPTRKMLSFKLSKPRFPPGTPVNYAAKNQRQVSVQNCKHSWDCNQDNEVNV